MLAPLARTLVLGALIAPSAAAQFTDRTRVDYESDCVARAFDAGLGRPTRTVVSRDWLVHAYTGSSHAELVVTEDRRTGDCRALDLDATSIGSSADREILYFVAVGGDTLALQVRHWPTAGATPRPAVLLFRDTGGVWTFEQSLEPDPADATGSLRWGAVTIDGDRLVLLNETVIDPVSGTAGEILTYRRPVSGPWSLVGETPGVEVSSNRGGRFDPGEMIALEGDLLVCSRAYGPSGALDPGVFRWDGAQWNLTGTVTSHRDSFESVAIDGSRVVVGSYYDAIVWVYELDAAFAPVQVQTVLTGRLTTRDFNPPYTALVAAEDGELVIGVGDHFEGQGSLTRLRWYDGAYRAYEVDRGYDGAGLVALDGGELFVGRWSYLGVDPLPSFDVRSIAESRAVPFCETGVELLLSGDGRAPLDGANAHGYGFPADGVVRVFAGLDPAPAPVGALGLCIAAGGAMPVLGPTLADADGRFVTGLAGLDLGAAGPVLAGTDFVLQAVARDAAGTVTSNAQRIEVR
ncbi:MAG: hypothetical protein AAFP86_03145 [Planctomycetota bacterium]